ncbi:hypothetical protein GCM10010531_37330 [Blastococcus jejuensis]|uniref:Uncharacterized protein n=1 Tax=Blastococcus jejuensis TaxID=351224 RepID=A0ABP6PIQ2_9ACTN
MELVERRVEVQVPLAPSRRDWTGLLSELASQLNDGRVYDRDLPALARAQEPVLEGYRRRAHLTGAEPGSSTSAVAVSSRPALQSARLKARARAVGDGLEVF